MRILYAEDEPILRDEIALILEMEGHTVEVANDGQFAWEALTRSEYDLLITDIKMPRMDGVELITKIKGADSINPQIIVTSAYTQHEQKDRFHQLPVSAYLEKPFSLVELLSLVS